MKTDPVELELNWADKPNQIILGSKPKIWDPKGREIFPKKGKNIPFGSMVLVNSEWITLETSMTLTTSKGEFLSDILNARETVWSLT